MLLSIDKIIDYWNMDNLAIATCRYSKHHAAQVDKINYLFISA